MSTSARRCAGRSRTMLLRSVATSNVPLRTTGCAYTCPETGDENSCPNVPPGTTVDVNWPWSGYQPVESGPCAVQHIGARHDREERAYDDANHEECCQRPPSASSVQMLGGVQWECPVGQYTMTLRATSPASMARNASFTSSSAMRRVTSASRSSRPALLEPHHLGEVAPQDRSSRRRSRAASWRRPSTASRRTRPCR